MATATFFDCCSLWSRHRLFLTGDGGPLAGGVFLLAGLGVLTHGPALGILMSIAKVKRLVQS
jgi:hypothetical protein